MSLSSCPNCRREFESHVRDQYCPECWKAWNKADGSFDRRTKSWLEAAPPPQTNLLAIADAARAYVDAVNGEPEKDCWDTEDGKEASGAERFASDWSWKKYDDRKQKAFDALRAALASEGQA